jgi:hypothetical protein
MDKGRLRLTQFVVRTLDSARRAQQAAMTRARGRSTMDDGARPTLPDGARDGDVLVLMGGQLFVVDHLVPEALTIDLVALAEAEADAHRGL